MNRTMTNLIEISERKLCLVVMFILSFITSSTLEFSDREIENVIKQGCDELGDCASPSDTNCNSICGCDRSAAYYYNETTGECLLSFKHLMVAVLRKYSSEITSNTAYEQGMAQKIELEAERTFKTLLLSVLLIITCSLLCVVSACLYCCRITYIDYKLKADIKDLSRKMNRKQTLKRTFKRPPPGPVGQSCNIVCEDAGVFVV